MLWDRLYKHYGQSFQGDDQSMLKVKGKIYIFEESSQLLENKGYKLDMKMKVQFHR